MRLLHAYWSPLSSKKWFIMMLQNLQITLISTLRKAKNKFADKYGNIHFSDLSIDKKPNVAVLSSFKPKCRRRSQLKNEMTKLYSIWYRHHFNAVTSRSYLPGARDDSVLVVLEQFPDDLSAVAGIDGLQGRRKWKKNMLTQMAKLLPSKTLLRNRLDLEIRYLGVYDRAEWATKSVDFTFVKSAATFQGRTR